MAMVYPNWLEYAYHTNPNLADTDGDGYSDGVEVSWGSDPTDAKSVPIANMTVASSPTGIGHPQPIGYGVFSLPLGSTVTDAVSSLVYQGSGTRYQNIGWLGTGDVPSVGLTNNLRFTLNVNSSLTWLWGAQYALSIATNYSTSAKFVARDESSKWLAPDGTNDDGFGWSVAVDGDTAVVGAPFHQGTNTSALGGAYILRKAGTNWNVQAFLDGSDTITKQYVGCTVAICSNRVAIGALSGTSRYCNRLHLYQFWHKLGS